MTPYIELGGVFNERMEIRFDPGGMVTIVAGTHSHGQGHATAFAQLVAEWLGVPFEAINYIQGDTEKVAFGRGTFAARSSLVGGNGLRIAADAVIARGKQMAGALMEAAPDDIEFKAGTFTVIGTDKRISIGDVARAFFAPAGPVLKSRSWPRWRRHLVRRAWRRAELPERLPSLRGRGRSGNRRRPHRPLRRRRRSRHGHQPDDL